MWGFQGSSDMVGQQLSSASDYLEKEVGEAAKCQDLFQRIQTYEKVHPVSFKVPPPHPSQQKPTITMSGRHSNNTFSSRGPTIMHRPPH